MRDHETAEHEKNIDPQIAFAQKQFPQPRRDLLRGRKIAGRVGVIKHHPQRGQPAQGINEKEPRVLDGWQRGHLSRTGWGVCLRQWSFLNR
jgi:hypothetical protein